MSITLKVGTVKDHIELILLYDEIVQVPSTRCRQVKLYLERKFFICDQTFILTRLFSKISTYSCVWYSFYFYFSHQCSFRPNHNQKQHGSTRWYLVEPKPISAVAHLTGPEYDMFTLLYTLAWLLTQFNVARRSPMCPCVVQ